MLCVMAYLWMILETFQNSIDVHPFIQIMGLGDPPVAFFQTNPDEHCRSVAPCPVPPKNGPFWKPWGTMVAVTQNSSFLLTWSWMDGQ